MDGKLCQSFPFRKHGFIRSPSSNFANADRPVSPSNSYSDVAGGDDNDPMVFMMASEGDHGTMADGYGTVSGGTASDNVTGNADKRPNDSDEPNFSKRCRQRYDSSPDVKCSDSKASNGIPTNSADACDDEVGADSTEVDPTTSGKRAPGLPSLETQRQHYKSHIPFRSWCKHCVQARLQHSPHIPHAPREPGSTREVHLDYAFFRNEVGGETVPIIVLKERDSKALAAHVVPYKGANL